MASNVTAPEEVGMSSADLACVDLIAAGELPLAYQPGTWWRGRSDDPGGSRA